MFIFSHALLWTVVPDGDGILTPEELLIHFNDLGIHMDAEVKHMGAPACDHIAKFDALRIYTQACNFLFEDVDANGDGKLQFEEFVVMVFHCSADLLKLREKTVSFLRFRWVH